MTLTRSGREIAEHFEGFAEAFAGHFARERALLAEPRELDGSPLRARYNLCPSRDVLTLVPAGAAEAACEVAWKRWGLVPAWAKDPTIGNRLFNARAETAAEKPSFRAALRRRRCLVVADGFYEWTPRKRDHRPHHFRPVAAPLLAFAGLFEAWRGPGGEVVESCTVLTTEASEDLRGVHHRMPVILTPGDAAAWLDPETPLETLGALTAPAPAGTLARRPVSRWVNDPRHDDPRCLEPEPEPEPEPETEQEKASEPASEAAGASEAGAPGSATASGEPEAPAQGSLFGAEEAVARGAGAGRGAGEGGG